MRPLQLYTLMNQRHKRQQSQARSVTQRASRASLALALFLAILVVAAVVVLSAAYASLTAGLPSIQTLPILLDSRDGMLLQPTSLYDRSGRNLLYKLENPGIQRRYLLLDPQQTESLAPQLVQVVITLFDPDFWQHPGFDAQRLSQIEPATLAERLVDELLLENEPANLRRALRMRLLAAQVTAQFGRARVLEWYLNSASFGHLAYGAESAAQLYLGKTASKLNLPEAALLAAALEAPALNPLDAPQAALERQQWVLDRLLARGSIGAEQREQVREYIYTPLALPAAPEQPARAFTSLVLEQLSARLGRSRLERGGLRIVTTLDLELQYQVACTLQAQLIRLQGGSTSPLSTCQAARLLPTLPPSLRPSGAIQGSAIVLDPSTGQVLAYVGDSTPSNESAMISLHTPGTLLTPFLAVSGFASGFSPASLMWDIPSQEKTGPPEAVYRGPLRLRSALANDTLAPLEQVLWQIGPANVWRQAEALGLTALSRAPEPSQLLDDGGELSLPQIAQAYGVFATQGTLYGASAPSSEAAITPISILLAEDLDGQRWFETTQPQSRAVLGQQLAYLVHHVLSDEMARWPSLGHPNALEVGRPAGAKTGQTGDGSQVWTAGYTPQRVAVVWVGLPGGAQPDQVLDVRAAAGIWHAVMQYANRDLPVSGWNQPPGISTMDVCDPSGLLPSRACPTIVSEVFLDGNEPNAVDSLYQVFQVNRETNRLATVFTPPELVEDRTYLVIPAEAQAWGRLAGLPVPPADYDLIQPPLPSADAQISLPVNFSAVRGKITIRGSAAGSAFATYRIQAGAGLNPKTWVQIGQESTSAVRDGILAVWETPAESGLYALRLQVIRQDQRVETAIIQVSVDNTPPNARILAPYAGQKLKAGGAAFSLQAEASDSTGIQRVEFWMDDLLVGERLSAPFTFPWQPLPGSHALVVKAYDLAGNLAESARLTFTVE